MASTYAGSFKFQLVTEKKYIDIGVAYIFLIEIVYPKG